MFLKQEKVSLPLGLYVIDSRLTSQRRVGHTISKFSLFFHGLQPEFELPVLSG
jgi:hypothetical protein